MFTTENEIIHISWRQIYRLLLYPNIYNLVNNKWNYLYRWSIWKEKRDKKKETKAISFMERPLVERDEEWWRQIWAAIILRSASSWHLKVLINSFLSQFLYWRNKYKQKIPNIVTLMFILSLPPSDCLETQFFILVKILQNRSEKSTKMKKKI